MWSIAAAVRFSGTRTLTSITRWNRSCQFSSSRQLRDARIAAQCAIACTCPLANNDAMKASEVRSPSAVVHVASAFATSAAVSASEARSLSSRCAPSWPSTVAVARPMPLAAPVTRTRRPRRSSAVGNGTLVWLMLVLLQVDLDQSACRAKAPACGHGAQKGVRNARYAWKRRDVAWLGRGLDDADALAVRQPDRGRRSGGGCRDTRRRISPPARGQNQAADISADEWLPK